MRTSAAGVELIKKFEGCELTAYRDAVGVLTIGYGHTGPDVKENQIITESRAEELLRQNLEYFEREVSAALTVPVNQNQFDALISFAYNVGIGALRSSTLLRLLNEKTDKKIVASEFLKWTKAGSQTLPGLVTRRKAEQELFLKGAKNDILAHTIIAQRDTWLKRKPLQASELDAVEKLFVPKGAAHEWSQINILPGETHYKISLSAQPEATWWFFPTHWKIINDPKVVEQNPIVTHPSKLVLDVPYYSQRDNAVDPERTCFSSSCAMLLKYLKPGSISGDDEYINTVFTFGDTTSAPVQLDALAHYGVNAEFKQTGGWTDIDSQLVLGIPVPIGILHHGPASNPTGGGHWIVVIGRNETNTAYIVNDPNGELDLVNGGYVNSNGKHLVYSKKNLSARWLVEGPGSGWFIKAKK